MSDRFWWYAVRSTGMVSWAAFAGSMLAGGLLAGRVIRRPQSIRTTVGLHRHASALALVLLALHLVALIFDGFVRFSVLDVLVPYVTRWRPGAVAWGIVAMYVLVAVELSSLMHQRLSKRMWRLVHRASALGFASATIHLLQAGSERHNLLLRWAVMTTLLVLTFLYLGRPLRLFGRESRREPSQSVATTQPIV